jgi:hypothetical protein
MIMIMRSAKFGYWECKIICNSCSPSNANATVLSRTVLNLSSVVSTAMQGVETAVAMKMRFSLETNNSSPTEC